MSNSTALGRVRQATRSFRFNDDRDDLYPGFDTVKVFCPSPLTNSEADVGIFGAPVVVLKDYKRSDREDLTSVTSCEGECVVGRMVELHPDELARLDQVAERAGYWHRFLTEVVGPRAGSRFSVWVFQHLRDSTHVEMKTSATALTEKATNPQLCLPLTHE